MMELMPHANKTTPVMSTKSVTQASKNGANAQFHQWTIAQMEMAARTKPPSRQRTLDIASPLYLPVASGIESGISPPLRTTKLINPGGKSCDRELLGTTLMIDCGFGAVKPSVGIENQRLGSEEAPG
ncbi:MAG: hypothetical protein ACP5R4_13930 [Armatimonadota bacterium]